LHKKVIRCYRNIWLGECYEGIVAKIIIEIIKNDFEYTLVENSDLVTDGYSFSFEKDGDFFDFHYNDYCDLCLRTTYKKKEKPFEELEMIGNEILEKVKSILQKKTGDK